MTAEAGAPVVKYDYETQQLTVAPGNVNNTSKYSMEEKRRQ